jgi:hypothetical protein
VAKVINQGAGLAFLAQERPVRVATMNALVGAVLLAVIAFLMLVNLMLLAGESTGLSRSLRLLYLRCCLSGRRLAFAVALAEVPR